MATLVDNAKSSAEWIATALNSAAYNVDFTILSLKEIDRFFDEHSENGEPTSTGLLSEQLGVRIFSLGSYVGEVIQRAAGGFWRGDDADPRGEINIELVLPNDTLIWPVQRVMKRLKNGRDDEIYAYVVIIISDACHPSHISFETDCSEPI
jgi:hypothetical protein